MLPHFLKNQASISLFYVNRPARSWRARFRWPVAMVCLLVLPGWAVAAEPAGVTGVEQATGTWVKARLETSRLETEWRTDHQLLESTIGGLTERAQTLEDRRDFLKGKTAKDREELATLEATEQSVLAEVKIMDERARTLSARLIALRATLPPRLSAALEMAFRSLQDATLGTSERMQLNLTVLNRCTQFNRSISCEEEVIDVGGPNPQLLDVLYWGLGQGYALDRAAGRAWKGMPGPEKWQWEPLTAAAPQIASMIDIFRDKAEPALVSVPVRLLHGSVPATVQGKSQP